MTSNREHWEDVYRRKAETEVSWFQDTPTVSLELIASLALPEDTALVDVGGGASRLVDHLLRAHFTDITVLDISEAALAASRKRLGDKADRVTWIVADVTQWRPDRRFGVWHDRAVLHFLTARDEQARYAEALKMAVAPNGWAIIAGFAPGGPTKCSGLDIVQHDASSLTSLLGRDFELCEMRSEMHRTPAGAAQAFRYHLFKRLSDVN